MVFIIFVRACAGEMVENGKKKGGGMAILCTRVERAFGFEWLWPFTL